MPELSVVPPAAASPLEELVRDYLNACRANGLARATIKNSYGYPLQGIFLPWCAARGIREVGALDSRTLDAFVADLHEVGGKRQQHLSKHSVHAYVRALRGFLNWCRKEEETVTQHQPPLPRLKRRDLDVLSRDEIERLEDAATNERDRLIIRVLGDTGMRAAELCALTVSDVRRRDRQAFLRVQGKGGLDRLVPILPDLLRRIERYIRSGRPKDVQTDRLFVSRRRAVAKAPYEPLTPSGLLQIVQGANYRAELNKHVTVHLLRHSFITNALRGRMDSMQLATIVGHTSLRMIHQVYAHLNADDSYEAMLQLLRAQ